MARDSHKCQPAQLVDVQVCPVWAPCEPLYRSVSDYIIQTDHRRVAKVAEQILREVRGDNRAVPDEFHGPEESPAPAG